MKRILVTGGPVHAYLDPVKIVTNKFRGGTMVELAERLGVFRGEENDVTMLCSKSTLPNNVDWIGGRVVHHDGFEDYRAKVKEMAPEMDVVILGAAVANLIPLRPYKDKFPSHNYKVGDVIPIDFTIAPRVIDEVKSVMKPGAHLFGFKLLAGQSHEELIRAAYETLLGSHASVVVANDPLVGLDKKFVVTKERSVLPMSLEDLPKFFMEMANDEYYSSSAVPSGWVLDSPIVTLDAFRACEFALDYYRNGFVEVEGGMVLGSVAFRFEKDGKTGFVTTVRGKRETDELVYVEGVDHGKKLVSVMVDKPDSTKASLNAPLVARIFEKNPSVKGVLHFHRQEKGLPTQPWAPPGTVRDTERDVSVPFNVEGHGCYLFVDEKGGVKG